MDVPFQSAADVDYVMTADDILDWEEEHGTVPKETIHNLYTR